VGPSMPGLVLPASLTRLVLKSPVEAGLLALVPTTLRCLEIEEEARGPAGGSSSFLAGLARLQNLRQLCLGRDNIIDWPPAGPAYSAFTASTHLVSLELLDNRLPEGVWQYVFPSTLQLPHLSALWLEDGAGWGHAPLPCTWSALDVSRLVSWCPNLCSIDDMPLQHGSHVSELRKLTALTTLAVNYSSNVMCAFEKSLNGLAAVTQRRELNLQLKQCCSWTIRT
jgi:hypothetical protein